MRKKEVVGDMKKVIEIVRNYLSNGIKFTKKGEVKLEVSILDENHDKINNDRDNGRRVCGGFRRIGDHEEGGETFIEESISFINIPLGSFAFIGIPLLIIMLNNSKGYSLLRLLSAHRFFNSSKM